MNPTLALVVEPNAARAQTLASHLYAAGFKCSTASDGDQAWTVLAAQRPQVVFATLGAPGLDRFQRRLRDEFFGKRPQLFGVADPKSLAPDVAGIDFDAVLMHPIRSAEVIVPLLSARPSAPIIRLDAGRLREMLRLSCLESELQASLDAVARRLALIYSLSRCTVLAVAQEQNWLAQIGESADIDQWEMLWEESEQALNAGAPLVLERQADDSRDRPAALVETRLAVTLPSPSGEILGAICLIADGPRLFDGEARDALADLADRLGVELNWRSVHSRLTNERDRLRETAMLDPMLGILSRGALEQALQTELARVEQSSDKLVVAVLDITGLRHINDHYGHLSGDAALRHVADMTRRIARPQDIVGRSGDDEIAVVLSGMHLPAATAVLDRILKATESEPFDFDGDTPLVLQLGIGVTEASEGELDGGDLLGRARKSATAAGQRGGAIAIADRASPSAETNPNISLEQFGAGMTIGGMYQIVHEISRGAMGVVYRAEDMGLSRPVAVKMLRPDLVRDADLVRNFREEAGILASLNHENLVRVYSFIEEGDDVAFVMELVEGVSLDTFIGDLADEGKYISPERTAAIMVEVARALDAMHHAGVMHRDVKPGNVVLDRTRDRAVLVDVGLARRMGDKGEPAGTPGYIAPESFRGDPESPATDVYGLAATSYATLTGMPPFGRSDDYREILIRQLERLPEKASVVRKDLQPAVDEVLFRGLSVRSQDRYPTAGDFAQALEVALGADATGMLSKTSPLTMGLAKRPPLATQPRLAPRGGGDTRRSATIDVAGNQAKQQHSLTRGIVFRSVSRVLGIRDATAWIHTIERTDQSLADALSLRTSPLAWLPADHFHSLFRAVSASGRNSVLFARNLGRLTVEQSFRRFYPSSPESLSPQTTLRALDILWRKYQTWATFEAIKIDEFSSTVILSGAQDLGACGFAEGWLQAVITLSGGKDVRVRHALCASQGAERCQLAATWA